MTRREFDNHFAASDRNWFEPETLDRLNDLAFSALAAVTVDEAADDPNIVKFAFDCANNNL